MKAAKLGIPVRDLVESFQEVPTEGNLSISTDSKYSINCFLDIYAHVLFSQVFQSMPDGAAQTLSFLFFTALFITGFLSIVRTFYLKY